MEGVVLRDMLGLAIWVIWVGKSEGSFRSHLSHKAGIARCGGYLDAWMSEGVMEVDVQLWWGGVYDGNGEVEKRKEGRWLGFGLARVSVGNGWIGCGLVGEWLNGGTVSA